MVAVPDAEVARRRVCAEAVEAGEEDDASSQGSAHSLASPPTSGEEEETSPELAKLARDVSVYHFSFLWLSC